MDINFPTSDTLGAASPALDLPLQPAQPKDVTTTPQTPIPIDPKVKKRNDEFRSWISTCKQYRSKQIPKWSTSIDYRRGKPFTSSSDDDQIAVNLDWSLTKSKQAALFSQVPEVRIAHGEDLLVKNAPWALPFQKKLNDTIRVSGIESAMDECLPDCINAAGFGLIMVSYESIKEDVEVPSIDISTLPPNIGAEVLQHGTINGEPVPTETIPRDVAHRYLIQRLSPSDFLWPINFTGSNFDNAPWVGRSGRISWPEALQQFGKSEDRPNGLTEGDKESLIGEDRPVMDRLTHDVERDKLTSASLVGFDEIFYRDFQFNPDSKSYTTIHRLVFVVGKDQPVIDEPWTGQKVEGDHVLGAQKYPVRVLTLSYITDEAIPPSDSAIGRPQVNEINKLRTLEILNRQRSIPIRTFDVNRLDPTIQQSLMRGKWQGMIPVQGDGQRIIAEISRASTPPENYRLEQTVKNDLQTEWTLGPNQLGSGDGIETKGEAQTVAADVALPRTRERARVASFFVGIAEVLGGFICLYEDPSTFGEGFTPEISLSLSYSILADSTILLDANQKLQRLDRFLNTYAKSGWVNLEPVLQEIAQLSGLDPSVVIRPPNPKPPVEPNISLRLTGVEDLLNPISYAMMIKSGQAPSLEQIEQAKAAIQQAVIPPQGSNLQLTPADPTFGGAPMLPQGVPLPPPAQAPPPGTPLPMPAPPRIGEANPNMAALDKVTKRTESGRGQ